MPTLAAQQPTTTGIVRDLMRGPADSVGHEDPISKATKLVLESKLHRVVVVDKENAVLGVISQRDLVRHYLATSQEGHEENDAQIQTLLRRERPITIHPDVPLLKAAAVLASNKIGCLPVVNEQSNRFLGILSLADLLRRLSGISAGGPGAEFMFYQPSQTSRAKMPAFIRRSTGDLVLPLGCIQQVDGVSEQALLGFDDSTGRILIKFAGEGEDLQGSMPVKQDRENVTIRAEGFVKHFQLSGKTGAYDVKSQDGGQYLVLTPR